MTLNFPSPATSGQIYAPPGGPVYRFDDPVWTAVTGVPPTDDVSGLLVTATGGSVARTLSDWFEYMGREKDVVTNGPFWADVSPTASPLRVATRLFVGTSDYSGDFSTVDPGERSWLGQTDQSDWIERDGTLNAISKYGGLAIVGAARAQDNGQVPGQSFYTGSAIGVTGVAIADAGSKLDFSGNLLSAWAYYGEYRRGSSGGLSGGYAIGMELDGCNWIADSFQANPYGALPDGSTVGLWLSAGLGQPTSQPLTLAMGTNPHSQKFKRGLMFHVSSLVQDGNLRSTAIVVGKGHEIKQWYSGSDAAVGSLIRFDSNDATNYPQLVFTGGGIVFMQGSTDVQTFQVATKTGAVNGMLIDPGTTGQPVVVRPPSSLGDANIPIVIQPKGTSSVALRDSAGANKIAANTTGIGFFAQSPAARGALALPTGTTTRTTYDTATVTLPQLAERVAAMITDFRAFGLFS